MFNDLSERSRSKPKYPRLKLRRLREQALEKAKLKHAGHGWFCVADSSGNVSVVPVK